MWTYWTVKGSSQEFGSREAAEEYARANGINKIQHVIPSAFFGEADKIDEYTVSDY